MRICYTVAKPAMTNLVSGVFTNRKKLFIALDELSQQLQASVQFHGALKYETKKFNYFNLCTLLNHLNVNESFALKFQCSDDKTLLYEITVKKYNVITN